MVSNKLRPTTGRIFVQVVSLRYKSELTKDAPAVHHHSDVHSDHRIARRSQLTHIREEGEGRGLGGHAESLDVLLRTNRHARAARSTQRVGLQSDALA